MNSYEIIGRILRLPPSYEHVCRIAFCKISRVRLLMSVLYSYFMPVCSIVELLSRGAVDDLMHYCTWPKAECNNASGRPGY